DRGRVVASRADRGGRGIDRRRSGAHLRESALSHEAPIRTPAVVRRRTGRPVALTSAPMPTVLIIDDEPNIRRMVGPLLAAGGYDVRDAADGASGVTDRKGT